VVVRGSAPVAAMPLNPPGVEPSIRTMDCCCRTSGLVEPNPALKPQWPPPLLGSALACKLLFEGQ